MENADGMNRMNMLFSPFVALGDELQITEREKGIMGKIKLN
jgi:hypothetical protein